MIDYTQVTITLYRDLNIALSTSQWQIMFKSQVNKCNYLRTRSHHWGSHGIIMTNQSALKHGTGWGASLQCQATRSGVN